MPNHAPSLADDAPAPRPRATRGRAAAVAIVAAAIALAVPAATGADDPPERPRPRPRPVAQDRVAPPVDPARIPELLEELGVEPIEPAPSPPAVADELVVRIDLALLPAIEAARAAGGRPRVLLLWTTDVAPPSPDRAPAPAAPEDSTAEDPTAPVPRPTGDPLARVLEFAPHPVHAFAIDSIDADGIATLTALASFPAAFDEFAGDLAVTAVLELDEGRRPLRPLRASGRSTPSTVSLARDRVDRLVFEIGPIVATDPTLGAPPEATDDDDASDPVEGAVDDVPTDRDRADAPANLVPANLVPANLVEVRIPSRARRGHEHRAWVALPQGFDDLEARRRIWPIVLVLPDEESPADRAAAFARLLGATTDHLVMPQAVWAVLDHDTARESDLLVEEFLPWLDVRFRVDARPEAHLLLGAGWAGRRALDLLLRAPDRFGKAWAIAPELLDARSFIGLDLLRPSDAFTGDDGLDRPMRRSPLGPLHDRIELTWREAVRRADALSPSGRTPLPHDRLRRSVLAGDDPARVPPPVVAPAFGLVDLDATRTLAGVDVAPRLADAVAATDGAFAARFTILCGERDSWYRDLAVRRLAETLGIEPGRGAAGAPLGPLELFEEATTDTIGVVSLPRLHRGMESWLIAHELD